MPKSTATSYNDLHAQDITNLRQTHHPSILITIISGLCQPSDQPGSRPAQQVLDSARTVFGPMCHGIVLSIFNPTAREDGNMPTSLISHKLPLPSCESAHGLLLAANERSTKV
ncbi:hypothetical protein E4U45_005548 [Claviceps purpurea]|nr:hypothetical protein E4U45_005548 [Claviceps purpurea]